MHTTQQHGRRQRSESGGRLRRWTPWMAVALALIIGYGAGTGAAPFRPRRVKVPDEVRSLKGIRRVSVQVDPLLGAIGAAGVQRKEIRSLMISRLRAGSIEVVEDDETPRLVLKCLPLNNPKIPDTTAVVMFLQIKQDVQLNRLNEPMILPTTTILGPALTKRDDLGDAVKEQCSFVIDNFIKFAWLGERQPRKRETEEEEKADDAEKSDTDG